MAARQISLPAIVLAVAAAACALLVALAFNLTRDAIEASERAALSARLGEVLPEGSYDNILADDVRWINAPELGGRQPAYLAFRDGEPTGVVMTVVAPDGYSGPIRLLVGIDLSGAITGVRIVSHRETPGLGDFIEADRSDWVFGFDGRSLRNPVPERWAVRKDGGEFDQVSGATITARAVVTAVRRALEYFQAHRDELLGGPRQQ